MTVPVGGSLGGGRKTGRRCLPEIHATRLSVSGSLRPKIGLLLLLVVLIVSLCLLGVPLVSHLLSSSPSSPPTLPLYLSVFHQLLERQSTHSNLVYSPSLLNTTLSSLIPWTGGVTKDQLVLVTQQSRCNNCTHSSLSGRQQATVFLPARGSYSQQILANKRELDPKLVRLYSRDEQAREQVKSWLKQNNIASDLAVKLDIHQINILTSFDLQHKIDSNQLSELKTFIGNGNDKMSVKYLRLEGDFPLANLANSKVVRLNLKSDDLLLELVLPTGENWLTDYRGEEINFQDARVMVEVPPFTVSWLQMFDEELRDVGVEKIFNKEADLSNLVTRPGGVWVNSLVQSVSVSVLGLPSNSSKLMNKPEVSERKSTKEVPEKRFPVQNMIFDRPFMFIVREKSVSLPLLVGLITKPNPP